MTNEQYGGASTTNECSDISSVDNEPRNCLDWFEASDYCEARGPDSLVYPWGDDFITDNAVYMDNSDWRTAPVAVIPAVLHGWARWT